MRAEFSPEAKLEVIEHLIETTRLARSNPELAEHHIHLVLKALARDLRAALPGAAGATLSTLEFAVNAARRSQAQLGFLEVGHQQAIATRVLAHWPVIRLALQGKQEASP